MRRLAGGCSPAHRCFLVAPSRSWCRSRERLLGLIMAFGSGVLISAVAYELVAEAFGTAGGRHGRPRSRCGRRDVLRRRHARRPARRRGSQEDAAGTGGTVGAGDRARHRPRRHPRVGGDRAGLLEGRGVSVAILAAVFLSNLPEAIAATTGLRSRLDARPDPRPVGARRARLRAVVVARLRRLRLGAAPRRSRSCSRSPAARS